MPPKRSIGPHTKPKAPYLFRKVQPDWYGLFGKLTGVVTGIDPKKPQGVVAGLIGALPALFRLKPQSLEEEVFVLIQRGLVRAIGAVTEQAAKSDDRKLKPVSETAGAAFDRRLREEPIEIGQDFFTDPTRLPLLGPAARWAAGWLREIGIPADAADEAVVGLPACFVAAVEHVYREHRGHYPQIKAEFDPRFGRVVDVERAWLGYHLRLQTRSNPEVLDLGVSLDDVYVELRAYYERPAGGAAPGHVGRVQPRRTVGMLWDMAEAWVEKAEPAAAVLVVSGGPGSGKSAFSRRFAAWRAWAGPDRWKVLYIPLHRFEVGKDLKAAVAGFAERELGEPVDVFDPKAADRLLLVFDGLDELSKQGKVGQEDAADFYRQAEALATAENRDGCRVKVLLCGRPVAVDLTRAAHRADDRVLHVLPYLLTDAEQQEAEYEGRTELLRADDRRAWWTNYQRATGREEVGLPAELDTDSLRPLTAEPMLNGLVARVLRGAGGERTFTPTTNRATVYGWLLEDVFTRRHDPARKVHVKDLTFDDFAQLMEEMALCAWHGGDVRSTTHGRVVRQCDRSGVGHLLARVYPDDAKKDVTALFLAFFFRQAKDRRGEDEAYEFTHKSFGEYLLARRMVRLVDDLTQDFNSPRGRTTEENALKEWAEVFGPARADEDLYRFLRDVVAQYAPDAVRPWQKLVVRLIGAALRHGLPMDKLELGSFREMNRQAVHAEQALLVVHSACAWVTEEVGEVDWPGDDTTRRYVAGDWLARLVGQRAYGFDVTRCLNFLSLTGAIMAGATLYDAVLTGARLDRANLFEGRLVRANLDRATLNHAKLDRARLTGAMLREADLTDAMLIETDLTGAVLHGARLDRAVLDGARLDKVKLSETSYSDKQLLNTSGTPTMLRGGTVPAENFRDKIGKPKKRRTRKKNAPPAEPPPTAEGPPG